MRVVAGTARGRRLVAPPGHTVRPTADRVRQATFNALESRGAVRGARVVDLFAGTGALAIEALSRGADSAVLIESDRVAVEAIRSNLATTGMSTRATVIRDDVLRWAGRGVVAADLVLADPPYGFDRWAELLDLMLPVLSSSPIGLFVMESEAPLDVGPRWEILRQQRYGGTVVAILEAVDIPSSSCHKERS